MKKRPPLTAEVVVVVVTAVLTTGGGGSKVNEGFERRVKIDEGSEIMSGVMEIGMESENER